ncbi:MAG TPA: DNA-processing protein DprA [Fervidobacterium sp.]|nr:DNA-processing protein DprA [Fervidobacterium sp.]HUM75736.1 DNA-processing protein DprA [Fervidobacterium sp.]
MRATEIAVLSCLNKKSIQEMEEQLNYGKTLFEGLTISENYFLSTVSKLEDYLSKNAVKLITYWDEGYPEALKNISDPPVSLFIKGNAEYLSYGLFAVVGTRKMTNYGKQVTEMFTKEISKHFVVVSGMAYGVDSVAHTTCIKEGRPTIAILGCGVDYVYPKSNEALYKKILENGCVVSEYLPWDSPKKYTFVARNRIISGLSQGILVTEAGMESGALITARFGIEQGKDVFAIPGDIFRSTSKGTNELIKNGAYLVSDPSEILEYYGFKEHRKMIELSEDEKTILQVLESSGTQDVESIAITLSKPISELLVLFTVMELKGLIYKSEDGSYKKAI